MAENTKIQWATHTFNPWIGCTKVSPGCANCYAEMETFPRVQRSRGRELWGKGKERYRTSEALWNRVFAWNKEAAGLKHRPRVFPSMCDPFDEEVPTEWKLALFCLINQTQNLDWLLLTKRPDAALSFYEQHVWTNCDGSKLPTELRHDFTLKLLPNLWLGVSAENQKYWDERVSKLMSLHATVLFVSVEPLLGEIEMKGFFGRKPDWIIVGGESGINSRSCNTVWINDIVEACRLADVPCFVKQLGTLPYTHANGMNEPVFFRPIHKKGGDLNEWAKALQVRQFPKL